MITRKGEYYQETQECLLSDGNFVAKSRKHSLESGDIAWEASTLPLSYTRPNRLHFSPKIGSCKECTPPLTPTTARDRILKKWDLKIFQGVRSWTRPA